MQYQPMYFRIEELVSPEIINTPPFDSRKDLLWWLFDDRILITADRLRGRYGRMLCNTWLWGGSTKYRGFRPSGCPVGSKWSQHKFGRALDLVPLDTGVDDIRANIINGEDREAHKYVTAIELKVSWLHLDCRNNTGLLKFSP